jgi:hypothetical protein
LAVDQLLKRFLTIVTASRSEYENQILKRKLESIQCELPRSFSGLRHVSVHLQGLDVCTMEPTDLLVINTPEWRKQDEVQLLSARQKGYRGPVLVIVRTLPKASAHLLQEMHRVVLLYKPYEPQDLCGLVLKMLQEPGIPQQVYPRYRTNQDAEIEFDRRPNRLVGRVCNLSKGGANLEFEPQAGIQVGDLLKVKLELAELNRVYKLKAKVVWTKIESGRGNEKSTALSAGVQFVGSGQLMKHSYRSY